MQRALLLAALCAAAVVSAPAAGPNILLMMADDLGWNDVGYNGSEIQTPTIDRLAAEGLRLDRYYAFPFCTPTRVAMMTGRSPLRFGMAGPIIDHGGLPLDETTMGEVFRSAGYQTWFMGKWHLGHGSRDYLPNERGWDHSYGSLTGGLDHYSHNSDTLMGTPDWHRNGEAVEEEGHTTDLYTREAVRLIENRDQDKPFLLYVAWNAPHTPLQAPDNYLAKYADIEDEVRCTYAAMVTQIDDSTKAIVAALEQQGLRENTLVVWVSDNGGTVIGGANNEPLRDGKGSPWEGGVRVPGFVNWPGRIEPGVLEQQVSAHDWLPTLIAATGVPSTVEKKFDGFDMWPAIAGGESVERGDLVLGSMRGRALFSGRWKYVESSGGRFAGRGRRGPGGPGGPGAARGGRPGGGGPGAGGPGPGGPSGRGRGGPGGPPTRSLYDVAADPAESRDLAAEHPDLVEKLAAAAHAIDADAPPATIGFDLRDGAVFQRQGPLVGFPEDRGPHVLELMED